MKRKRVLLFASRCVALGFLAVSLDSLEAGGAVYTKSGDAPRPSKTPQGITLASPPGSQSALVVKGSLAQLRLDHTGTRGTVAFTGNLNVIRKFVRLEMQGKTPLVHPAVVKVKYTLKEGEALGTEEETVAIKEKSPAYVVDFEGYEDTTGTEVKSTSTFTTATSTRYKHFNAEFVSVHVTVLDAAGKPLFSGAWPNPSTEMVELPEYLKPRVFTDLQGRRIEAMVAAVGTESATLVINGKIFEIPLATLSEPDRAFLSSIRQSASR